MVRNAGDRSAILAVDHFRFRLHYRVLSTSAKSVGTSTGSPEFGLLDPLPCYGARGTTKSVCDRMIAELAVTECASAAPACIDRAARALDWTRSGAAVDAFHRVASAPAW